MTPIAEGQRPTAPPSMPVDARQAIRWVCTANPFYAVSAGLFLAGLWISFGDPLQVENTWALMSGLIGYTVLLALTALLLVRFAKVWDDARTVLLLVVLMFLATSATFDNVLVADYVKDIDDRAEHYRGIVCFLLGLVVAVGVSEALLRGIGLALPVLYRVPYYLILSFFFLYPLALIPLFEPARHSSEQMKWALFSFSSIGGLVFLTLLPAIRRGGNYVRANGSPWPWPLYPWSLFVFLGLAVVGRAILLCYSMHQMDIRNLYSSIFGLYFLVPFGLALAVLLLEAGLVHGHVGAFKAALVLPLLLAFMSLVHPHGDPAHDSFLQSFILRVGAGPSYVALAAAALFYLYAALRRAPAATEILTGTLVLLSFAGPTTTGRAAEPEMFAPFQHVPLLAVAVLQMGLGAWRRESWRCMLGCLAEIATIVWPGDPATMGLRWLIASQLSIAAALGLGAIFSDELALALRTVGVFFLFLCALAVMFAPVRFPDAIPGWLIAMYPLASALFLACYGTYLWSYLIIAVATVIFASWLGSWGWHLYEECRKVVAGLDYIVSSFVLFLLAVLVSLGKSGILSRWLVAWRGKAPPVVE